MKSWKRFLAALMAGFLIAFLIGPGISFNSARVNAAEPSTDQLDPVDPADQSVPADQSTPTDSTSTDPTSLEVEGVSTDGTLPIPADQPPDGTLKVPPDLQTPYPENAPPASEPTEDVTDAATSSEAANYTLEQLIEELDPDVAERAKLLMYADRLYLAGNHSEAEALYRQAKDPLWDAEADLPVKVAPITRPEDLPPAGAVYWREAKAGAELGLEGRTLVPLQLLIKEYPEFLPGQALYVEYLLSHDRADEAAQVVESAIARYPFNPDLLKAQTQVLMSQEKWLEAAITARQFTIFNASHPESEAMLKLAQENTDRFRGALNERLTNNLIGNIFTGVAGYLLTGGLLGPFTAINSSFILLQGESGIGAQVAEQAVNELPIMDDPTVNSYVDSIGQKLAALAGRDEFDYDFHVVMDKELNAFALPGGKVFVNAGAILKTESEAELAGLLGHEISHAALSHGFQMVTQGNLTTSLAAFIPIPEVAGIAATLVVSEYSRDMERQADVLGTQILAAGNFAADGLHNLMVTLREENDGGSGLNWFASHPAPDERVGYLKQLVDQGGFNRFAYEGVEPHLKIRKQVEKLMADCERENPPKDES
ncbi:MAG TPA: M48 family metalloprotease [Leptolyngbyaceae cyanobacterium]